VRRARHQPTARVLRVNATAQVQSAWIGRQRRAAAVSLPGPSWMTCPPVRRRAGKVPQTRRGFFGDKIGAQTGVAERAADDLLYFAFMQVNARSKHSAA